jgi:hypothetical protein
MRGAACLNRTACGCTTCIRTEDDTAHFVRPTTPVARQRNGPARVDITAKATWAVPLRRFRERAGETPRLLSMLNGMRFDGGACFEESAAPFPAFEKQVLLVDRVQESARGGAADRAGGDAGEFDEALSESIGGGLLAVDKLTRILDLGVGEDVAPEDRVGAARGVAREVPGGATEGVLTGEVFVGGVTMIVRSLGARAIENGHAEVPLQAPAALEVVVAVHHWEHHEAAHLAEGGGGRGEVQRVAVPEAPVVPVSGRPAFFVLGQGVHAVVEEDDRRLAHDAVEERIVGVHFPRRVTDDDGSAVASRRVLGALEVRAEMLGEEVGLSDEVVVHEECPAAGCTLEAAVAGGVDAEAFAADDVERMRRRVPGLPGGGF